MATIYIAIFFVILFLIGMIFFRKDDDNVEENNLKLDNQQLVEDVKDEEITEKERVRVFAENFTTTYHSYTWGNFSNIESQYYYMTDDMRKREENKIEKMKSKIKNQARKYFTVRAKLIDSEFLYYEKTKASLKIYLSIDGYAGAIVERDTMVWVDEKGDYYGGDSSDLIISAVEKNIEINLVKIGDEWKIDEIEEVEK